MSNSRTITIYATKGKKTNKIESSSTTWGELRQEVSDEGYDVNSLLATESVNRTDLNHKDAKIPESSFILFMRPKKTKSGIDADSLSYRECKTLIKNTIFSDGNQAKNHFCDNYEKNYTHMSTSDLRNAINDYSFNHSTVDIESAELSGNEMEEDEIEEDVIVSVSEKVNKCISLLEKVCEITDDDDICERVDDSILELRGLKEDVAIWENQKVFLKEKNRKN